MRKLLAEVLTCGALAVAGGTVKEGTQMTEKRKIGNLELSGNLSDGGISAVTNTAHNMALHWQGESKFTVRYTAGGGKGSFSPGDSVPDGLEVNLEYLSGNDADFACIRLSFEAKNGVKVNEIELALPRFQLPGNDVLTVPQCAGMRYASPAKQLLLPLEFKKGKWKDRYLEVWEDGVLWPEELDFTERTESFKATMQFLEYGSPEFGNFYLGAHEPGFENTYFSFHARKGEEGIALSVRKVLNRPVKKWSCDFVFGLHEGDWHRGADYYRKFFDSTGLKVRRSSEAAPGLSCHYDLLWQNGDINHRYRDLPQVAAMARQEGFDTVLFAGWNRGGFDTNYPDFRPEAKLGTEDELKSAVRQIRQEGSKVLFYINAYSFDHDSPDYAGHGQASAVITEDGKTIDVRWGSRVLTAMCNGSPWWREKVLDNVRYLVQEIGADGVYIDQLNVLPPVCCAENHNHDRSVIANNRELVAEMRRRFGEKVILLSEWSIDAMSTELDFQLIQTIWRNQKYSYPEFFRYTFPEAGTVDMILQKPWGADDPEVEGRFVGAVYDRLFVNGIKFWCYDHVSSAPGFEEHFKLGMMLWKKYANEFNSGRFMDDTELEKVPSGVIARTFRLPDGRTMLTAANRSGASAHVLLKNGTKAEIPADRLSVTIIDI